MADAAGTLPRETGRVRTLFISDVHLGTRDCQAERLLHLLGRYEADVIYLIGDIVDGWRLKARWYWPQSHDEVVRCLLRKLQAGTRILYIPGNHDEFLRNSIGFRLGGIEVVDQAVHLGADGRRHLVLHGDRFDSVVARMRRLAALGILVYAAAVLANDAVNRCWRRLSRGDGPGSAWARRRLARKLRGARGFERLLAAEAARQQLAGVICGHVHHAAMHDDFGVQYINAGDWVQSCTAVIEHRDGRFELLRWPAAASAWVPPPAVAARHPVPVA
jgi:UDP-2,3-diacylglucosamine pyrophosphatase LpxH